MKRGLVFAKYGARAASTRQRFVQAMPYLQREGITIDICPLFDDTYLDNFFSGGTRKPLQMLKAYGKRMFDLFKCGDYDFI
jgi:hypothetical protein